MRTKFIATVLAEKIDANWKEQLDKLSWEEVKALKGKIKDQSKYARKKSTQRHFKRLRRHDR